MTFKPGTSGNPAGRRRGSKNKATELRKLLDPYAPMLVEKAVQMALEGNTTALKLCIDKLIPNLKSLDHNHSLNEDKPVKFVLTMGKSLKNKSDI